MRVKVCGVKSFNDAEIAIKYGADAIGLLVGRHYSSDDFISEDLAQKIAEGCPPYITPVLVTHLVEPEKVFELARYIGVYTIQLHADITVENIQKLRQLFKTRMFTSNIKLIKSLLVIDSQISKISSDMEKFHNQVDAFIIDTANEAKHHIVGTGTVHDWSISRKVVEESKCPVILAGGLHPQNVSKAIRIVKPFGVDANSCLKNSTGFKDREKVAKFVYSAKQEFLKIDVLENFERCP